VPSATAVHNPLSLGIVVASPAAKAAGPAAAAGDAIAGGSARPAGFLGRVPLWLSWYFGKWAGDPSKKSPSCQTPCNPRTWRVFPGASWQEVLWAAVGTIFGILAVSALHFQVLTQLSLTGLVASFGASAVLIYAAPAAPLSQPRNLVLGHMVSALCGVTVRVLWSCSLDAEDTDPCTWAAPAVAVALAIIAMQATGAYAWDHARLLCVPQQYTSGLWTERDLCHPLTCLTVCVQGRCTPLAGRRVSWPLWVTPLSGSSGSCTCFCR